jgi:hypothetical protein
MRRGARGGLLAAALSLLALLVAPAAHAATFPSAAQPEVGIEDENGIFSPGAGQLAATWRALGVASVRVEAYWDVIAPQPRAARRPAGFNPANPNDPRYRWGPTDAAIATVLQNGMRVNLTINQCGPRWASDQPRNATRCWRPNPRQFALFAAAVATRYRGQITRYLLGSEPNQRQFLAPQYVCSAGSCTPEAPNRYRDLVNAAYPALKRADPGTPVLIGELAPLGSAPSRSGGIKPLAFIRALACVNASLNPIRTAACRRFRAPLGDAFGYHPYVNNRRAPTVPNPDPDIAKIGDINRLLGLLDRLTAHGRLRVAGGGRFAVYFTEYGYISNPPSPGFGVPLALQARYDDQSAYIVWQRRARIKLLSQYLWRDDKTFGTGLLLRSGRPKPALYEFPHPFFIDTAAGLGRARFWGQVRPDASRSVVLQVRARGARTFRTIRVVTTDAGGYWTVVMSAQRGASYRYRYFPAGGGTQSSSVLVP